MHICKRVTLKYAVETRDSVFKPVFLLFCFDLFLCHTDKRQSLTKPLICLSVTSEKMGSVRTRIFELVR
jgi:hypothetical protein